MRVLMSAYACLPNAGSEPRGGWSWVTQIANRGLDVVVLTVEQGRERIEQELRERPRPNLRFHYVPMPKAKLDEGTGPHYLVWQWMALREARKLAKSERFDVIHHVTYGSIHVPSQLWRLGLPIIFGPVGGAQTAPRSMLQYFGASRRKEELRSLFTYMVENSPVHRRWLRKMSLVLVSNTETLQMVRRMGRKDAQKMFDTGVPVEDLQRGPRVFEKSEGPVRLLWVGRMMPRKAIGLSFDILQRVKEPATLTVIGEGLPVDHFWQMVKERGLEGKVFWEGRRLPWNEVQEAYPRHDAVLANSLRDTGGSQLIEAMTVGLPIITLDLHGPGDLVPPAAGFKVPVHSPEQVIHDMAAAVDRFARLSPEEKTAMSRAGWEFACSLNEETRAQQAEEMYRRLAPEAGN